MKEIHKGAFILHLFCVPIVFISKVKLPKQTSFQKNDNVTKRGKIWREKTKQKKTQNINFYDFHDAFNYSNAGSNDHTHQTIKL